MINSERERAVDAVDVLNDFVGDFVAGVMVLREYSQRLKNKNSDGKALITIHKMCISYLILALCKWLEFYDKYKTIIPDENREDCKKLLKILREKNVMLFRNRIVGHIWDKTLNRPLKNSEIMEKLNIITNNNLGEFLSWINDPNNNEYPSTVVSIVETTRDGLVKKYYIKESSRPCRPEGRR